MRLLNVRATIVLLLIFLCSASIIAKKKVVGYCRLNRDVSTKLDFTMLTDLIGSTLSPNSDGSLNTASIDDNEFDNLITKCKTNSVNVLIMIAGKECNAMASDPTSRAKFVSNITQYCIDKGIDGVDMDWEQPNGFNSTDRANYTQLLKELHASLKPKGLLLTMAGGTWSYEINREGRQYLDWLNVMAYDMGKPEHSTMEDAERAIKWWTDYGFELSELTLGVPFYGTNSSGTQRGYSNIVDENSLVDPATDMAGGYYFNGVNTIKKKAQMVLDKDMLGIMIWEISLDKYNHDLSLLPAIDDVLGSDDDPVTFLLTVTDGTGAGHYISGKEVAIVANSAPDGKEFSHWSGGEGTVADSTLRETTVTMPSKNLIITATYSDVEIIDTTNLSVNLLIWAGWEAMADTYGSASTVDTTKAVEGIVSGTIETVADNAEDSEYSWAKVSAFFEAAMDTVSLIKISYSADSDMKIVLDQEILADNGAAYYANLPKGDNQTRYLPIKDFTQNQWEGFPDSLKLDSDLKKVGSVSFEGKDRGTVNFSITELKFTNFEVAVDNIVQMKIGSENLTISEVSKGSMSLSVPSTDIYNTTIYGVNGRVLYKKNHLLRKGARKITFNLSQGIHLISIRSSTKSVTKKSLLK